MIDDDSVDVYEGRKYKRLIRTDIDGNTGLAFNRELLVYSANWWGMDPVRYTKMDGPFTGETVILHQHPIRDQPWPLPFP